MILKICFGSACHVKGSYEVINILTNIIKEENLEDKIEIKGSFCLNNCTKGVTGLLENEFYSFSKDDAEEKFRQIIKEKQL